MEDVEGLAPKDEKGLPTQTPQLSERRAASDYLDVLHESVSKDLKDSPGFMIEFRQVVQYILTYSYQELVHLSEILVKRDAGERKRILMDYVVNVRKIMLKALILSHWVEEVEDLTKLETLDRIVSTLSDYSRSAADDLVGVHSSLAFARTPNFDIAASIDILSGKGYTRLPQSIEHVIPVPSELSESERQSLINQIHEEITFRLLTCHIPPVLVYVRMENGVVLFRRKDEFEFAVTLQSPQLHLPPSWKVVYIKLLVHSSEELRNPFEVRTGSDAENFSRKLIESLQQKIASHQVEHDPFALISVDLHNTNLAYALEMLYQHTKLLIRSFKSENISIEYVPRSVIKIFYWRESPIIPIDTLTHISSRPSVEIRMIRLLSADDLTSGLVLEDSPRRGEGQLELGLEIGHNFHEIESLLRTSSKRDLKIDLSELNLAKIFNQTMLIHASFLLSEIARNLEPLFRKSGLFSLSSVKRDLGNIDGQDNYLRMSLIGENAVGICLFIELTSGNYRFVRLGSVESSVDENLQEIEQKVNSRSLSMSHAVRHLLAGILRGRLSKEPSLTDLDMVSNFPFKTTDRDLTPMCGFFIAHRDCLDWQWILEFDENGHIKVSLKRLITVSKCPLTFESIESALFFDSNERIWLERVVLPERGKTHEFSLEILIETLQNTRYFTRGLMVFPHIRRTNIIWSLKHLSNGVQYEVESPKSSLSSSSSVQDSLNILGMFEKIRLSIFDSFCECLLYIPKINNLISMIEQDLSVEAAMNDSNFEEAMVLSFSEKSDPVEFWFKILSFSRLFAMSSRLQKVFCNNTSCSLQVCSLALRGLKLSYLKELSILITYSYTTNAWQVYYGEVIAQRDTETVVGLSRSSSGEKIDGNQFFISWMQALEPFWERWLSTFWCREFDIASAWSICLDMYLKIAKFFEVQKSLEPASIHVIPKDCNYLRLFYKTYIIEIMAIHGQCLLVADGTIDASSTDFSTRRYSQTSESIPDFYQVANRLKKEGGLVFDVLKLDLSEEKKSQASRVNNWEDESFCMIENRLCGSNSFAILPGFLERFLLYWIEHLSLIDVFKSTTFALERTGKVQNIDHQTPFEISFVIQNFQCAIFLTEFVFFKLKLHLREASSLASSTMEKGSEMADVTGNHTQKLKTLDEREFSLDHPQEPTSIFREFDSLQLQCIENYFAYQTNNISLSELKEKFKALFRLLLLPIEVINNFCSVMYTEMYPPSPSWNRVEWCLCMPDSVSIASFSSSIDMDPKIPSSGRCALLVDDQLESIHFVVRFWNSERTEFRILGLQYHPQSREILTWNESLYGGSSSRTVNTSALLAMMSQETEEVPILNRLLSKWRLEALTMHPSFFLYYTIKPLLLCPWDELRRLIDESNSHTEDALNTTDHVF